MAAAFARRIRAREEAELSPLATRSYPARRARAGARLRAAHAVSARPRPDRPLQGVPAPQAQDAGVRRPERRPLPHAADPHARGDPGLAHGRPRAARSTRTWSRRSGSATTSAIRRSATSARRRSTAACASASARAFHHHEHSLRVVDTLERDGAGAQPDRAGPRRDPQPLRAARPSRRRSRAGSSASSTASPTSTTTSTTPCAPACSSTGDLPGRADRDPRRHRLSGGSTRSSTTSSSTPTRPATIVQGERVGDAMSELRTFMFERVYLGPVATREHAKIDLVIAVAVRPLLRPSRGDPGLDPRRASSRGGSPTTSPG